MTVAKKQIMMGPMLFALGGGLLLFALNLAIGPRQSYSSSEGLIVFGFVVAMIGFLAFFLIALGLMVMIEAALLSSKESATSPKQ